jgi:hypothetical protein
MKVLTVTRKDDPIDLTREENTYSSDYARSLERLFMASSQAPDMNSAMDIEVIDVDEYHETRSVNIIKNKKRLVKK